MSGGWLVTGAHGMLGRDLTAALAGHEVTAMGHDELDITDAAAVRSIVGGFDIVVNAAAWTNVDGAESNEEAATAINGGGPRNLAESCAAAGVALLHLSTDYVFPGYSDGPYAEDAAPSPVNAYGRSKLAGEIPVRQAGGYVVRTAWLYGEHGRNFVATMLDLAAARDTLDVVDDQRGQPTWSAALAERLVALGEAARAGAARPGVYHATAAGETTWFGLARAIFAVAGLDPERVRPTTSGSFVLPAARPAYSVLGHDGWAAAGLAPMGDWETALKEALARPAFIAKINAARAASA